MAGFFDTLFGGGAEKEAADKNRALYDQYQQTGTANLNNGLNQSLGALGTGIGNANATLGQNAGIYNNYGQQGQQALASGLQNQLGALGQAKSDYAPLSALASQYGKGTDMYMNSLGLNGAAGNQAATSAFQAGPGYQWQLDQGLNALNRRQSSAGMLNSGNSDIDALTYGQGLANQAYGGWQSNLSGLNNQNLSATGAAASGMAGADSNIASAYGNNANAQVGLAGNVAQGLAGTNSAIAGNQSALGQGQAGLYGQNASDLTNLAGSVTSGNAAANNAQAAGEAAGAKNLLGAGMGLATLGTMGLGGGFGGLGSFGGTAGSAVPGAWGATSFGGANGPTPLMGGNIWGRMFG